MSNQIKTKKRKFKMPTAFTILFLIMVVIVLISWILKWAGVSYNETHNLNINDDIVGTTTVVNKKVAAAGIVDIFYAMINGFISKADVIVFIVALGGFIQVILKSKALDAFTQGLSRKLKNRIIWLIPILMVFFSFCGSTYGMAEESLGFYMIMIPLMIAAGFDKAVGLMIVLFGAGVGVLASTVNPFVIAIAADAAKATGVTQSDGMAFRWIFWVIATTVSIVLVMWYAKRVHANPQKSVVFETLEGDKKFFLGEKQEEVFFDGRKIASLTIFLLTFVIMVAYMVSWDSMFGGKTMENAGNWLNNNIPYLTGFMPGFGKGGLLEVGVFFIVASLIIALINWRNVNDPESAIGGEEGYINEMLTGARDMLGVCLVIAVAAGIGFILENTGIQTLVINGLTGSVGNLKKLPFLIVSFIVFLPLSFLIPSTSGFAAAIFPIWGPTAAAAGGISTVSGSIAAFSFASGVLNLFTPTSGVVMGALGIAKIEWGKFMKHAWPFILIMTVLSAMMLIVGSFLPSPIF